MKKRLIGRALVSTAVLMLPVLTSAQGAPPTLVVTDSVRQMEFHDQISLTGRTEAWVTSRVVAEVSGRVEAIAAGEGAAVQKDQTLVMIDGERMGLALQAKAAEAEQARVRAALAADNLRRAEDLFSRTLISTAAIDSARAGATMAEQSHRQLEAERRRLEVEHDNCTIRAPFSGYTGRKLVDVGEWVSPGTPVFELVDVSTIRVRVDLPERYFGLLSVGSPATIGLSERGGEAVAGRVVGISPNASEDTHTFPVIVEVPNHEGQLAGGMLVRATLSLDNKFTGLAVSKDAIIRQGAQTLVYTVHEGKAAPIPVVTTSTNGKMVAVRSEALRAGTPVVVRGNERIYPGAAVMIADGSRQANPPKAAPQTNQ